METITMLKMNKLSNVVLYDKDLTSYAKMLYIALTKMANDSLYQKAEMQYLSIFIGCSKTTLYKSIRELEKEQCIIVKKIKGINNKLGLMIHVNYYIDNS